MLIEIIKHLTKSDKVSSKDRWFVLFSCLCYCFLTKRELLKQLSLCQEAIAKAAEQYKPSILARYLITLCQVFNDFYEHCPCMTEPDKSLAAARVKVVEKTKDILKEGLSLLGIEAPEEI